mmetsp:Transcript_13395/g.24252  ORF Transcript_13395/g.24252 Transcript_13395/m.24252 type:complete len:96 (+) Transcript_13395:127-414(+)
MADYTDIAQYRESESNLWLGQSKQPETHGIAVPSDGHNGPSPADDMLLLRHQGKVYMYARPCICASGTRDGRRPCVCGRPLRTVASFKSMGVRRR